MGYKVFLRIVVPYEGFGDYQKDSRTMMVGPEYPGEGAARKWAAGSNISTMFLIKSFIRNLGAGEEDNLENRKWRHGRMTQQKNKKKNSRKKENGI